jgi:hypothetical protein
LSGFSQTNFSVVKLDVLVSDDKTEQKELTYYQVTVSIDSIITDTIYHKKGIFKMNVCKDKTVQVTFTKKGYIPKTILVNTLTSNPSPKKATFYIKLVLNKKLGYIDYSDLSFPVVKICYDNKYKRFDYDNKYNLDMQLKYIETLQQLANK